VASVSRPQPRGLIVKDAGPVRDPFRDALGHAGFEVDIAATATEALDRLATRRDPVTLGRERAGRLWFSIKLATPAAEDTHVSLVVRVVVL